MLAALVAGGVCLAPSFLALQDAPSSAEGKQEPSVRFTVVSEYGSPLDLTESPLMIYAVDEQGHFSFISDFVRDPGGVCELPPLAPGRYWVAFSQARRERTVHEVLIRAGAPTLEERVALPWEGYRGDGSIMIQGLNLSEGNVEGRTTLAVRFTNPSGEDLAWRFVICGREGHLDGWEREVPAGPIEFTLRSRGKGRIDIRSPGYAPTGLDVDFAQSSRLDLGDTVLQPAIRVRARLVIPFAAKVEGVWWEYAPRASLERAGRYWKEAWSIDGTDLELGAEPFVVGAVAFKEYSYWRTPRIVFDPAQDGRELTLTLVEAVPLILDPIACHDPLDLEVLDEAGLLVERDVAYVDVPHRIDLIPGAYTLRHSIQRGTDEPRAQMVVVGSQLQHVKLER